MQTVEFITFDDEDPDLVLSFALAPQVASSITLQRTPRCESLLPDDERGVVIDADVYRTGGREFLVSVSIDMQNSLAVIVSTERIYKLSLARIPADDLAAAIALLRRMNFDSRFIVNVA